MDVLELFLDDDDADVAVTAKPAETNEPHAQHSEDLDLLLEEFQSAPDTAARKDALLAMLRIARG